MTSRQTGFDDDWRRSSYGQRPENRWDTYRPRDTRDRSQDNSRDPGRAPASRDHRPDRPTDLQLNTNIPTGPRGAPSALSGRGSPSSSTRSGPHSIRPSNAATAAASSADRSNPNVSVAPGPSMAASGIPKVSPKVKDPQIQPMFDTIYLLGEMIQQRSEYLVQKNQKIKLVKKRDNDAKELGSKADDFPSILDVQRKLRARDYEEYKNIRTKLESTNDEHYQLIENLAAAVVKSHHDATTPAAPTPDDSPIKALETKLAVFQTELAATQNRVQKLEAGRNISDEKIKKLEQERERSDDSLKALEAAHFKSRDDLVTVQLKCKELEKARDTTLNDCDLLRTRCRALEQKQSNHDTENTAMKRGVETLQTTKIPELHKQMALMETTLDQLQTSKATSTERVTITQQKFNYFDGQLKQQKEALNRLERRPDGSKVAQQCLDLSTSIENLEKKTSTLENNLSATQTKIEELEPDQFLTIYDQWVLLRVDDKIVRHEEQLNRLVDEVRLLNESTNRAGDQGHVSADDFKNEVERIKTTIDQVRAQSSAMHPGTDEDLKRDIETLKLALAKTSAEVATIAQIVDDVERTVTDKAEFVVEQMGSACGEMIDEVAARVAKLEEKSRDFDAARTPALTPQLDSRVSPIAGDLHITSRVKSIEDQNKRIQDRLNTGLPEVELRLDLSTKTMDDNVTAFDASLRDIRTSFDSLRTHVDQTLNAQQFNINNISTQMNNIQTTPFATNVIKQLELYGPKLNPRMDVMMSRISELERSISQVRGHVILTKTTLDALNPHAQATQQKRSASPLNRHVAEEVGKKRRLDLNGDHAPAVQPLRNGSNGAGIFH